jgi:molybdopterin-guanine dinucleotide biosynthesis protein A
VTGTTISRSRVSAIVLAGGRASRFGSDKLVAELDGESLLDRAITAVRQVADEVIVVGRVVTDPEVRNVPDTEPFGGPLAGLAAALDDARGNLAMVVGGDMPRLAPGVMTLMLARLGVDPSIQAVTLARPSRDGPAGAPRRQVLPLALAVQEARDAARAALASGDRSLVSLVDRLAIAEVPVAEWLRLDPEADTLLDVDTTADLERIRRDDLR